MGIKWSLVVLAVSAAVVVAGAFEYMKTQIPLEANRQASVQAQAANADSAVHFAHPVVALGRLEPEGRVLHCACPAQSIHCRIESLPVKTGMHVKKGQVLAVLEGRNEHEAACRQAEKQLAVALAELAKVKAPPKENDLEAQEALVRRLEAELANARKEEARYQSLYREGAVSASVKDSRELAASVCSEELNRAKSNLSAISEVRPVELALAASRVESARASLKVCEAELDLDYVRAPIAGEVLKIHSRPGEIADIQGILDLGNTARMVAVAEVYESDAFLLALGQKAMIESDAIPSRLHGKVEEIGMQIEKRQTLDPDPASDADSRVIEARIRLDAGDSARVRNFSNSHIKVTIYTEQQKLCHHLPCSS